jgi:chromate transporter
MGSIVAAVVGLLLAGAISISKGAITGWASAGIMVAVFLVLVSTKINPILLIAGGALAGYFAF